MKAIDLFASVWTRCDGLSAMHAYLAAQTTPVLAVDEILRAEWVARVSALDLYIHELVAYRMLQIFSGTLPPTTQFNSFAISLETVDRIKNASSYGTAEAAFDLEVRRRLSLVTYQDPEKIADGVRLISGVELWNAVALHQGALPADTAIRAKALRSQLRAIVDRRNKIAHEGDLQPTAPRVVWPIAAADLAVVSTFIRALVDSIDAVV